MKLALTLVYLAIAIVLTVVVLLQEGKDPRESAVMGGTSDTFFGKNKAHTLEGMMEKLTSVFAVLFFVLSIVLSLNFFK